MRTSLCTLRFHENAGNTREVPVRLQMQQDILADPKAPTIRVGARDRLPFRQTVQKKKQLTGNVPTTNTVCEPLKARMR